MDEPRYAIYFVPPADSALYRFGSTFLGYDCYSGSDLGWPEDAGLDAQEWAALTREPRRYGFHATLKAPFRLRSGIGEGDLTSELSRFAALPRIPAVIEPVIRSLGGFIAVVPAVPSVALDRLAGDCVTAFDRFRRPLASAERFRRLDVGLSPRQIANLDQWGYPYVFDEFRFHLTLTGPLDLGRRAQIAALLQARFEQGDARSHAPIVCLALVRQDAPSSQFHVICQAELTVLR
jgi:putative phosphonate metabolism protein